MKIQQIMAISPEKAKNMSTDELYVAVLDLSRSVNKMYNNMKNSPFANVLSVQRLERTGGRLSVMQTDSQGKSTGVPKTRNQLLHELSRGQRYYRSGDSSMTKMNRNIKTTEAQFKSKYGQNFKFKNPQQFTDFWRAFNRAAETMRLESSLLYDSDQIIESMFEMSVYNQNFNTFNMDVLIAKLTLEYLSNSQTVINDDFYDNARQVLTNNISDEDWDSAVTSFKSKHKNEERTEWRYGGTSGMFSGNS